jgi:acetolactate synthase-1/3 small subunit
MRHTISILVENKFGVLARVAGLFSGRGFNIETLNVGPTQNSELSRITVTIVADGAALDQAIKQANKLINVIEVTDFSRGEPFVARELVMVKLDCTRQTRSEIVEIASIFRAKVVDVTPDSITLECTGNDNKIKAFLEIISPFGIKELARTGNLALPRGA